MSTLKESDMYDWRVRALMNWISKNMDGEETLSMEKLSKAGHLDQYHYLGTACNEEVIRILGLETGMNVLDVGCGIGGPARYISWRSGCNVVGIDIQDQLVEAGNQVSKMVKLEDKVALIAGDVCGDPLESESFDAFISLLVILHIADVDRKCLFSSLFSALKPGGGFLIEDMVHIGNVSFDAEDDRIAKEVIGAPYLPNVDEYKRHLEDVGFVEIEFESLTSEWIKWCVDRSDQYNASKDDQIGMHGEKVYMQRSSFYADVKALFLSGKLGGVRITGRKPTHVETAIRRHRTGASGRLIEASNILERS